MTTISQEEPEITCVAAGRHDHHYSLETNEAGWRCVNCDHQPGDPAGFSPQLDRSRTALKVFAVINTLHAADVVYISNSDQGEYLAASVTKRCHDEGLFDQYSIASFVLAELGERHAAYWKEIGDGIVAGKDPRDRCHCGKLATCSGGGKHTCSDHWWMP